ncbi:spore wall protein 2-like isoform X2 [Cornus florida]|uniref:spore wall protein 2-like isoform X2 n=1 Tax=Cornus florida TaxID=4283 RepID=UPI002897A8CB|nr:spore wall protein 2-like isoform X2 [Cornus florida]
MPTGENFSVPTQITAHRNPPRKHKISAVIRLGLYMMYSDRAREVLEKERARISQSLQALSLSEVEEIRKQAQAIVKIFKGGDEEESGDGEPGEEARGDSADGEGVEGGSGDGETGEEAREDSADGQGVEVGSGDDEAGEEARGDSADGQGVKVVSGDDEAGEEARGDSAVGEGVHD